MLFIRKTIKMTLFLVIFFSTGTQFLFSQSPEDKALALEFMNMADEVMKGSKAEDQAKDLYVQAATFDPSNINANFLAGEFILKTVGKSEAAQYFEKVKQLDPSFRFDIEFKIGQSYQYGNDFSTALKYYNEYRNKLVKNEGYRGLDMVTLKDVDKKINECKNALDFLVNPADIDIVNVGNTINSEHEDFAPVLNENEDFLIFTSRRKDGNLNENVSEDNKPFEDIFFARKNKNNTWSYASNIGGSLNTKYHDSNLAISPDGNTLFVYKEDNNGDIFITTRERDTLWTEPVSLGDNINSKGFNESSVSIAPSGNLLFFSSNRPGGQGAIDIYYSLKDEKGEWQRARNVGDVINTEFNEDGPFIDYDGKTLYFSSVGHEGMGGYDIYKSVYDSAEQVWSEPVNLGVPINTPDDDIFFVATKDGKRGYYASVRENGYGFKDIYMVTLPDLDNMSKKDLTEIKTDSAAVIPPEIPELKKELEQVSMVVSVIDGDSGAPIDATVRFKNIADNSQAPVNKNSVGQFVFTFNNTEAIAYRLSIEASGYIFETFDITIPAMNETEQKMSKNVRMRKPKVNFTKVLRNIYFDFNKATFKGNSFEELDRLLAFMNQNPTNEVEIRGHTDNIGSAIFNKNLSQRRAEAVMKYLIDKGIDASRLQANGYGEELPMASNDDEREGRELNRRVEFKILK